MTVEASTKNLEKKSRNIVKVLMALQNVAETVLVPHNLNNWERGIGGDGAGMKDLSTKPGYFRARPRGKSKFYEGGYRQFKQDAFGRGLPDMMISGQMVRSFYTDKAGRDRVIVRFHGKRNLDVARGNVARRPGLVGTTQAVRKEVLQTLGKLLKEK